MRNSEKDEAEMARRERMPAVSVRFAEGIPYRDGGKADLTEELLPLKRMLMAQYSVR